MDKKKVDLTIKNSLLKMIRTINCINGSWPYLAKVKNFIKQFIYIILIILSLTPTIKAVFVQCGKDWTFCCENIAGTIYFIGVLTKYLVPIFQNKRFEFIYQNVVENWSSITDPEEQQILQKTTKTGNLICIVYIVYCFVGGICYSQVPIIPPLMDYFIPLNQSRKKILLVNAEYPFDPYEYYYELHIFYCFLVISNLITFMSADSTFTGMVHQSLALFKITKHRLEKAATIKDEKEIYEKLTSAIHMHQRALKFFDVIQSLYIYVYLMYFAVTITFVSFGSITVIERTDNIVDCLRAVFLEFAAANHLVFTSWQGQMIIDETEGLFFTLYSNNWYNMPPKAKTLIKIMMARCMKPCKLTAGGLYIMDLQSFGMIIRTTASYVAVALNFRE